MKNFNNNFNHLEEEAILALLVQSRINNDMETVQSVIYELELRYVNSYFLDLLGKAGEMYSDCKTAFHPYNLEK
jgi:hypothetical protein|tara:strand:- start:49 stop:270 length:222 start_codon:yes stop_codon:yes gene_type:complete